MTHDPEFQEAKNSAPQQFARDLAACYARVFLGDDDGKRVLADLRRKFGVERLVFHKTEGGRYDTISAALIEGERHVLTEIEHALALHAVRG